MASIKRCGLISVTATAEQNRYLLTVSIGTVNPMVKVYEYYDNGSTNVIDYLKDQLHKLSRFHKLDLSSYDRG